MIFLTGDLHGRRERMDALLAKLTPETEEGPVTLIVCGDFGFLWKNDAAEQEYLDKLERSGITIAFIDGNHENFDALNACEVALWNGGRTHRIRPHIRHLMRGECFLLEGKRFFTMGGAASDDKALRLATMARGGPKVWWPQELPDEADYRNARETVKRCGGAFDVILTHTAPDTILRKMGFEPRQVDGGLSAYLEEVLHSTNFGCWFFGHLHMDTAFEPFECDGKLRRFYCLYGGLARIG